MVDLLVALVGVLLVLGPGIVASLVDLDDEAE